MSHVCRRSVVSFNDATCLCRMSVEGCHTAPVGGTETVPGTTATGEGTYDVPCRSLTGRFIMQHKKYIEKGAKRYILSCVYCQDCYISKHSQSDVYILLPNLLVN